MTEPANMEEYAAKAMKNAEVTGYGMETTQNFPCPACAEPGWKAAKIMQVQEDLAKESTCAHCRRSFKVLIEPNPGGGGRFEFVQTGGDDLPDWLTPKMRRVP